MHNLSSVFLLNAHNSHIFSVKILQSKTEQMQAGGQEDKLLHQLITLLYDQFNLISNTKSQNP